MQWPQHNETQVHQVGKRWKVRSVWRQRVTCWGIKRGFATVEGAISYARIVGLPYVTVLGKDTSWCVWPPGHLLA